MFLLILCFVFLGETLSHDPVCGPAPDSFLDFDNDEDSSLFIDTTNAEYAADLGTFPMPYAIFDSHDVGTHVVWHLFEGYLVVKGVSVTFREDGLALNPVNLNELGLWYRTGSLYWRYTKDSGDLQTINSYTCDNFTAHEAVIVTFDCFRSEGDPYSPKARFQTIVTYGKDSGNNDKTFILFIYEVTPGDAWDMVWENFQHFIESWKTLARYPIPAEPCSVVAIDVTHSTGFTPGKEPKMCN